MLKSCKYCGKIHDESYICPKKPTRRKQNGTAVQFRNTNAWKKKREEIKRRDLYLCQICIRNLYDTRERYNGKDLSVHHAESLEENFNKRLNDDNLLTMCERHHKMAEKKIIPVHIVRKIIRQQETKNSPPGGEN